MLQIQKPLTLSLYQKSTMRSFHVPSSKLPFFQTQLRKPDYMLSWPYTHFRDRPCVKMETSFDSLKEGIPSRLAFDHSGDNFDWKCKYGCVAKYIEQLAVYQICIK